VIGVRGYALPEGAPVELYAGVDGVEHGQHLDPSLLDTMAAAGIALR
jgi:hypothetical protein